VRGGRHKNVANLFFFAGILCVELAAACALSGATQMLFVSALKVDSFTCDLPTSDPTLFEFVVKQVTTLHFTISANNFCEGGWAQQ